MIVIQGTSRDQGEDGEGRVRVVNKTLDAERNQKQNDGNYTRKIRFPWLKFRVTGSK